MSDDPKVRDELLTQIENRRSGISAFLHEVRPRRNRLTNVSIISSALAAALVAGPALGGTGFTDSVKQELSLSTGAAVWRPLCIAALIVSLVSVISSNLSKTHDLTARIAAAEVCNTELEAVMTSLHYGHLSMDDALEQYRHILSKVPFVEEEHERTPGPAPH